jgi:hypothetical protein
MSTIKMLKLLVLISPSLRKGRVGMSFAFTQIYELSLNPAFAEADSRRKISLEK